MDKSSVIHFARDQFLYSSSLDSITIMIMAKKGDIAKMELVHGDPYDFKGSNWIYKTTDMRYTGSDELYDYYRKTIELPHRRARYAFRLTDHEGKTAYFSEKGFYDKLPEVGLLFALPYLHHTEVFSAPDWVKDTVWYQIFPERFANGNKELDPEGTLEWGSADPTPENFFGGDLEGVINHLDYLKELGITGIYFTPIFHAFSNHKYDTIDYMEIDPQFGTKETLKKLVDEAHARGIKVMLDAVFNHSGYHFKPFQDLLQHGEASKYKDWFHPHSLPLDEQKVNYDAFGYVASMPKLNTKNPEVKEYLLQVAKHWILECGIDGWRLDVANEVDFDFWRSFRKTVKEEKEDAYILGEIWHDSMPWLRGDQFDAVMNYPFLTAILEMFSSETLEPTEFAEKMTKVYHMYPHTVNKAAFNLIGSHDTPRILTECQGDIKKVKQIYTILLTFTGTPCIYYGDEIGMDGGQDPGCRKCMPWDENEQDRDMFEHVQTLIALRKEHPVLANEGDLLFVHIDSEVVMYKRESANADAYVLINLGDNEKELSIEECVGASLLYANPETSFTDTLSISKRGFAILKKEK
ncbi:glycoside hydrolase family 13 protein [Pradoshia sp.]|uniref:glycoside hydrolase family 13 protein n=1 Tax=Pradoshia sp. TaxID=2651281 RepID=UPI003EFC4C78